MTNIGQNIRERRIALGMTQEELATKMGYKSKSTINKIEMGKNDVVQTNVVKFAKVLDTTPAFLMGWDIEQIEAASQQIEDKNTYSDQVELALKSLYEEFGEMALSPEDIKLIRDYANTVKGNEETLRYMAKARRRFVELNLNEDETEKLIEYAEFLASKRKS